jgi:hypothetical protein
VGSVEDVLCGAVGCFWFQTDIERPKFNGEPVIGTVQRQPGGGVFLLGLSTESVDTVLRRKRRRTLTPNYIIGQTDRGAILLSGISRTATTVGHGILSTQRLEAQSVVSDIDIEATRSAAVIAASGHWHDVLEFAGVKPARKEYHRDDGGTIDKLIVHLEHLQSSSTDIDPVGTKLDLDVRWGLSGPTFARTLTAPLRVNIVSDEPQELEALLTKLHHVQDLLSLAYRGLVPAASGTVRFADPPRWAPSKFWNRRMMETPRGARVPASMSFPMFYLSDIGGIAGVGRWLDLCQRWPRLVRPIISPYHVGHSYDESTLVDAGAAMECWRGLHARSRAWAAEKFQPLAVANSIGPVFKRWIGNADKWARLYWYHYNGLRHHIPNYRYDSEAVQLLALSGQALITCVALQEISDPRAPKRAVRQALGNLKAFNEGKRLKAWLRDQN